MIELQHIKKSFKVAKRSSGFWNTSKALFHKEYTQVDALSDISFQVQPGEIVGYIGPNGAGKSSTIKIMSGVLVPDAGTCQVNGLTPWENRREHVRNIGVVFGQRSQLWWEVPVIDSFELLRDIYDVDMKAYQLKLAELSERLQIGDLLTTPTRQLSLGQRMRCEIAASLLHSPSILFLDEPTIGLDALSKIAVRQFIQDLNQEHKTTIILTTHDMQDIEALAKRILLIGKGRILLDGSLKDLKKTQKTFTHIVIEAKEGQLEAHPGIQLLEANDGRLLIEVDTNIITTARAIERLAQQFNLTSLSVKQPTAEELVVNLYQEFDI